jgi:hypothetical protein
MDLLGTGTMSDVVDVALDRLIHAEQLRRDVAVYLDAPLSDHELALVELPVRFDLHDDDVDYDAMYQGEG